MCSPQEGFFSELSLQPFCILYVWCLFWCLLSIFRCHAGCHIHPWGLNQWGLYHCNCLEFTHGRHMCHLVRVIGPHQVCTVAAPSTTLSRGSLMLLCLLFPTHPDYMVGHTALGTWQRVTQSLCLPYMVGRGLLFQVWFHPMTWSTLNLQWALNLVIPMW